LCKAALAVLSKERVVSNTVLEIDLRDAEFKEVGPSSSGWMALLQQKATNTHTLVRTIMRASKDAHVIGLVVTMSDVRANLTELEEIRDAVMAFRAAGKKTLIHVNTFKEVGHGTLRYWFASAFEEIYMPSIGSLNFLGLKVNVPFFRTMLDKIGAVPLLTQRRKYKTAANMFMEEKFTKEHKESTEHLISTVYEHLINDIAAARGMSVDHMKQLMAEGPYSAERAAELKLLNGVIYEDEFYEVLLPERFKVERGIFGKLLQQVVSMVKPTQPKGVNLIFASRFYKLTGGDSPSSSIFSCGRTKVALINVMGPIHMGRSETDWDGSETTAGAESIVLAIRQAINDKKVKAILLRVASGGGSAVASDLIAQQVAAAKSAGKKVIVSMGQYAASGGYYVSCYADKIVACPLTVTGSIGVLAGKINLKSTWNKVGITFDSVQTSQNADLHDSLVSYDPENQAKLEGWVDEIYEKFKGHVAAGRKLTDEQVEALAQGQVWMGTAAHQKGLVDVLGGFDTALQVLKTELALKDSDQLQLVKYPKPSSIFDILKSPKNTRELPRAGIATWFLPNLFQTISNVAFMWRTMSLISQRPDIRSFIQTASQCDLSTFPNEIVMNPTLIGSGDMDLNLEM
jgi:protease-4